MIIKGFQKLTLLDFPGRAAATIFTPGCDMRCPFCHNASLVLNEGDMTVDQEEVLAFLKKRKGVLSGLAITGGEPLMQKDIMDFMKQVKDLGMLVKLDTNGSYPSRLEEILKAGLADYVAMDIKNCRAKYAVTSGLPESVNEGLLSNIDRSISLIRELAPEHEFRTTVVKELHTPEDFEAIGQWLAGAEAPLKGSDPARTADDPFFLQGFVDSGDILQPGLTAYSKDEMEELCNIVKKYLPKVEVRGL
ncbi:MAG: anaerobic ribonucleoside-triphosphate reductase activating protein [Oscillospiraceae bacterium]|nr:anaerobic ribonucleoside-triphosphate reductase activating protein [Oscillospiraceae bacterium]